jgi:hypothetical protein
MRSRVGSKKRKERVKEQSLLKQTLGRNKI